MNTDAKDKYLQNMENKQLTAVEWLEKELKERYSLINSEPLFTKALAMEKISTKKHLRRVMKEGGVGIQILIIGQNRHLNNTTTKHTEEVRMNTKPTDLEKIALEDTKSLECICCKKEIQVNGRFDLPAVYGVMYGNYGSRHDEMIIFVAICDDCVDNSTAIFPLGVYELDQRGIKVNVKTEKKMTDKQIVYLVKYSKGSYDDYFETNIFVTADKKKAKAYIKKANKLLGRTKKWLRNYEKQHVYMPSWFVDRWLQISGINKFFIEKVQIR